MKYFFTTLLLVSFFTSFSQITFSEIYHEYDDFGTINSVTHGDLNGDNIDDFVLSKNSAEKIWVGINNNLQMPDFIEINNELDTRFITIHDFDQDGDNDIIGSIVFDNKSYVWKNDGSGNFTAELLSISDYVSIEFADMDGDNIEDMILGIESDLKIYSIIGGNISLMATISDDDPDAIHAFDYNGDGLMDLATAFGLEGVKVFQQGSGMTFSEIEIAPTSFNNTRIVTMDLNNDMIPDFLLYSSFSAQTTILKSTSPGVYETEILPQTNGANKFTTFGNINQDEIIDILYIEEASQLNGVSSIFLGGDSTFTQQIFSDNYSKIAGGGITDLDNDGDNDLYFYSDNFFNTGLVFFINESATDIDLDNDGFTNDVDCDDNNPNVNPDQTEITYNGIDDDCDANTLDDDLDQDGFLLADDCDDNNPNVNSNQTEITYNGIDDDCDANTLDDDLDQDGFLLADDCNDNDPNINPNGIEIPNNMIDEDCDGNDLVTSTYELSNIIIDIFPNPTKHDINIVIPTNLNYSISLFDLSGRLLLSDINANKIDMGQMKEGLYFLKITDLSSGKSIVDKIVKMK